MAEVFVVDRAAFFGGQWPQGFVPLDDAEGERFLGRARSSGRFVARETAERTAAWKQWIPYCAIRCALPSGEAAAEGIFRVQRTNGQSEARLHGLWSIGLGGHVEPEDAVPSPDETETAARFFMRSLWRELREELHFDLPTPAQPRFLGLLNDDSTPVGQVHAGLVYVLDLPVHLAQATESLRVREISKMRGGFGSLVEFRNLWQDPSRFESWSQFLVHAGVVGPMGASV